MPTQTWAQLTNLTNLEVSFNFLNSLHLNANPLIDNESFTLLTNLKSLKINDKGPHRSTSIINFNNLTSLKNLTELDTLGDKFLSPNLLQRRYGPSYSVLTHFKELRVAKLRICGDFQVNLKCSDVLIHWFEQGNNDSCYLELSFSNGEFSSWCLFSFLPDGSRRDLPWNHFQRLPSPFRGRSGILLAPDGSYGYIIRGKIDSFVIHRFVQRIDCRNNILREGKGVEIHLNGSRYEGDFCNEKKQGRGTFLSLGRFYEGDWKDDKKNGVGILFGSDDSRYEGTFLNNMKAGRGVMMYGDGSQYEGDFQNNMREGKGVLTYPNGSKYEGDFLENVRHGIGVIEYRKDSGRLRYEGSFSKNRRHGFGIMIYKDGSKYEGNFRKKKREGNGVMTYSDGSRYEGEFHRDMRHGRGRMIYADGSIFQCKWKKDLLQLR